VIEGLKLTGRLKDQSASLKKTERRATDKMNKSYLIVILVLTLISFLVIPVASFSKEATQTWDLVNPEGDVKIQPMEVNPHPASLEGKTVMLRWNGKHNGDNFLNVVAEMISKQVKNVKIIKSWEVAPETANTSSTPERSSQYVKQLAAFKPDLVIGSQAD
jgi:hypothetical protein